MEAVGGCRDTPPAKRATSDHNPIHLQSSSQELDCSLEDILGCLLVKWNWKKLGKEFSEKTKQNKKKQK